MNTRQIFNHIKYTIAGGGTSLAQEIRWQSRKEITANKRRKQNAEFMRRRAELKQRQRNAQASKIYQESKLLQEQVI